MDVRSREGATYQCRCYQMVGQGHGGTPSPQYMDVIIRGAIQSKLPQDYVQKLREVPHNGNEKPVEVYEEVLKMITGK